MNIAICEDNCQDRELLLRGVERYCRERCYHAEIGVYQSGEALLDAFSPGAYQVVLLDIYLPGLDGIATARRLREIDPDCILIMVTVSTDHALDSYGVHAISYLVKPVDETRLFRALNLCRHLFERSSRAIEVPVTGNSVLLPMAGIRYAEVYGKNTRFHLENGTVETRLPLDEAERRLGGEPFLRCHRCYIVNLNHVVDVGEQALLLKDGGVVPMRKRGHKEVRLALARFLSGYVDESGGRDD
ncbi:LytTR family DNA-binding domain-containing protein [Ruminococcaceae bacterium OttesenSCG-928-D13]|nr:LytTR family DNA-binding domain-containing protein [Ruminococcaceae bacterium OttesenSCG-928-D13]